MKYRLLAIGWLAFFLGTLAATKNFTQTTLVEPFLLEDKIFCGLVFVATMMISFLAGIEQEN